MDLNLSELLGETTEYDKKRDVEIRKPKSWLKSISAFANGTGGTLIFGIADDDTVTGIEDIKSASEFVSQKIKERIDPFPEVTMQIHSTEDGKKPAYGGSYERAGNAVLLPWRRKHRGFYQDWKRVGHCKCGRIKKACIAWEKFVF